MTTDRQPWEMTLEQVVDRLKRIDATWMLVGSAATAIRGAAIVPGDIDILVSSGDGVRMAAGLLPIRSEPWPDEDPESWRSSLDQPVLTWVDTTKTAWTFGRWMINNTKVELANRQPVHHRPGGPGTRLTETDASPSLANHVRWHHRIVPIVPVELQLATMIVRGHHGRLAATLTGIDLTSLDSVLLRRAFAVREIDATDPRVPTTLHDHLRHRS
ncbi:MAG: hypothetical protein L0G99_10310 [Propionibacteriales bacterium]|nr:hypothetical protein [Propionibacteriales bacterium]